MGRSEGGWSLLELLIALAIFIPLLIQLWLMNSSYGLIGTVGMVVVLAAAVSAAIAQKSKEKKNK